jgi:signal transduction histidine kinase
VSLSSRIIVRLAVTTIVAAALAYGWLYIKQSRVETYLRERSLELQAQEIASYLSANYDGSVFLNLPAKLSEAYNNPGSRYRYAVRDQAGMTVAASGRRVGPLPNFIESEEHHVYAYRSGTESARMLGAAVRREIGPRIFFIQVERTVPITRSLNAAVFNEFSMDGGWLGIPFLIVLLGVGAFTVRRTLSPLQELASLALKIDPGSSTLRLPSVGIPAEVVPLVNSFNNALDRLDDGLRRQREFNANAAHQLRTPLAVLAANIDTMADTQVAAKLRYDVEVMGRIVHQLLLVARLETLNVPLDEPVDLCQTARQAAENLGPIAISSNKTLEVDEPTEPVFIRANGFVVSIAISNLIENALNHGPPGKAVRIRVTPRPSVEVQDSGPGIPVQFREKIFERFWRGDSSKDGAGLGLAIVRRIMSAINGSVSVTDGPEGGAQFTLEFPLWAGSELLLNP